MNKLFYAVAVILIKAVPNESLKVIHVNDIHAHFEAVNAQLGNCHPEREQCYGGIARLATKVKELRDENTIFVNAGDYYQGTIWYSILKYEPIVTLANLLNYTAYSLGNHDFDDGVEGLLPFAEKANFPILAANIECSQAPNLCGHIKPSITLHLNGTKIAIVGYITPQTSSISQPGDLIRFTDEIYSVTKESRRLVEEEQVKIIIALGHSGYDFDKKLAYEIDYVDLVIGGHSHSFLSSDPNPSDVPEGKYPTYVQQPSGKVVPVVQAGSYSKYLGYLELDFDADGNLLQPIQAAKVVILDSSVAEDPDILTAMQPYLKELGNYTKIIGSTTTLLDRNSHQESTLGDVVTDAFRDENCWDNIDISFVNNGGLRSVITKGNITLADIYAVLPFNNTVDKVAISGENLKKVLNDKLADGMDILQTSGASIEYTKDYESGAWTVTSFRLPCFENTRLCLIDDDKQYTIAMTSYLANGGDGWTFKDYYTIKTTGIQAIDCLRSYVEKMSPVHQELGGRIKIIEETEPHQNGPSTLMAISAINIILVLLFCAGSKYCFKSSQTHTRLDVPYQRFQ